MLPTEEIDLNSSGSKHLANKYRMHSLPTMFEHLSSNIEALKHAIELSGAVTSEDYNKLAVRVDHEMNAVLRELHLLKLEVLGEKDNLTHHRDLLAQCEDFREHLDYATSNLPPRLPQQSNPVVCDGKKDLHMEDQPAANGTHLTNCEYLRLLTTDQFEDVPKYIKGRLPFDKVNSLIEKLNGVYVEKYKILRLKKKGMDELNRKRCEAYRMQENKDTKGVHFIIDKDIEDFTTLKMDKTLRNILTMLRHCGLMHELRGDRYVRYACYSY